MREVPPQATSPVPSADPVKVNGSYQSGFCRHSKLHHLCHYCYATPKAVLRCDCECHVDKEAKVQRRIVAKTLPTRKIVAKS